MNETSKELRNLYGQHWQKLRQALESYDAIKNKISFPILLDNIDRYWDTKTKLMIVGQQTNGWHNGYFMDSPDENIIENLMAEYRIFNLGENYKQTPFINISNSLFDKLNPGGPKFGYIWTNLIKVDQSGNRPTLEIEEVVYGSFPVITEEIRIFDPDIIVFFTGPYYDDLLIKIFTNAEFIKTENYSLRELARIKHNVLPFHAYRAYHPKYLRLKGKESELLTTFVRLLS